MRDFFSSAFGASPEWASDIILPTEVEDVVTTSVVSTPTQPTSTNVSVSSASIDLSSIGPAPQDPYNLNQWLGELVKLIERGS